MIKIKHLFGLVLLTMSLSNAMELMFSGGEDDDYCSATSAQNYYQAFNLKDDHEQLIVNREITSTTLVTTEKCTLCFKIQVHPNTQVSEEKYNGGIKLNQHPSQEAIKDLILDQLQREINISPEACDNAVKKYARSNAWVGELNKLGQKSLTFLTKDNVEELKKNQNELYEIEETTNQKISAYIADLPKNKPYTLELYYLTHKKRQKNGPVDKGRAAKKRKVENYPNEEMIESSPVSVDDSESSRKCGVFTINISRLEKKPYANQFYEGQELGTLIMTALSAFNEELKEHGGPDLGFGEKSAKAAPHGMYN